MHSCGNHHQFAEHLTAILSSWQKRRAAAKPREVRRPSPKDFQGPIDHLARQLQLPPTQAARPEHSTGRFCTSAAVKNARCSEVLALLYPSSVQSPNSACNLALQQSGGRASLFGNMPPLFHMKVGEAPAPHCLARLIAASVKQRVDSWGLSSIRQMQKHQDTWATRGRSCAMTCSDQLKTQTSATA